MSFKESTVCTQAERRGWGQKLVIGESLIYPAYEVLESNSLSGKKGQL